MAPRGRKKIEIKRIEEKKARQMCFYNRRPGLFRKANELAVLCGVQVAAVVFSPGGKAFTYGHPTVESVLDRFPSNSTETQAAGVSAGNQNQVLEELNREDDELRVLLEAEKARKEAFAKARAEGFRAAVWLEDAAYVSEIVEEDLVAFAAALEKVHAAVEERPDQEAGVETMHQLQMPPPPGFTPRKASFG